MRERDKKVRQYYLGLDNDNNKALTSLATTVQGKFANGCSLQE